MSAQAISKDKKHVALRMMFVPKLFYSRSSTTFKLFSASLVPAVKNDDRNLV